MSDMQAESRRWRDGFVNAVVFLARPAGFCLGVLLRAVLFGGGVVVAVVVVVGFGVLCAAVLLVAATFGSVICLALVVVGGALHLADVLQSTGKRS